MKRSRVDEVQFGARGGPHRILTTQHNPVSSIQYLASSNSLKTTGVVSDASVMGGASTPTVQYTTYYPSTYNTTLTAGGTMKSNQQQQPPSAPAAAQPVGNPSSTPMHIINTSNVSGGNSIRHAKTTAAIQSTGGPALAQQSSNNPITSNIATVAPTTTVQQPPQQQPPPQQQQQQPPPLQPGGGPTVAGQEKFQRLKVEDALSYLDQVKYKFGNQPQVYNDFLDIMKEFKSQSIDTPGVIQRVSNLFKGHPELIVGFNTFLPPGYKIEVQANDQGVAFQVSVSVPSPSGNSSIQITQQPTSPPHKGPTQYVHTLPQSVSMITTSIGSGPPSGGGGGPPQQQQQPQNLHLQIQPPQPSPHLHGGTQSVPSNFARERTISTGTTVTTSGGISVAMVNPMANNNTNHSTSSNPSQSPLRSAGGGPAGPQNNAAAVDSNSLHHISQAHQSILHAEQTGTGQQPVEFNNAISYVNKIKNRFAMQPEKYKRFLEILHAYQKEQKNLRDGNGKGTKTLSEAEVYSQVAKLFDQQDDLLREFGQFLPDATSSSGFYTAPMPGMMAHNLSAAGLGNMQQQQQHHHQQQQQQQQPAEYPKKVVIPQPSPVSNSLKTYMNNTQAVIAGIPPPNRLLDHEHHHPQQPPTLLPVDDKTADYHQHIAMGPSSGGPPPSHPHPGRPSSEKDRNHIINNKYNAQQINALQQQNTSVKRSPSYNNSMAPHGHQNARGGSAAHAPNDGPLPPKRHKPICRDITLAEASKYGALSDYAFFDKARKAVRNPDVYENFLRCLTLYNQEILSKTELLTTVTPFLRKFPELLRWFQDFLVLSPGGLPGVQNQSESISLVTSQRPDHRLGQTAGSLGGSGLGGGASAANDNNAQEIDLSTCKRLGASYCALPKQQEMKKCSGRTTLCKEVLNDQWASFPTWAEDSTFVTSRKTHYEEIIYRCEDERFELDVVIETNSATIRVLEGVAKRMSRMGPEEMVRFRLDDMLGGNSPTIHQRALRRIYGDKAAEVIQGLKKNPAVAVPVVLKRLKSKEEEWREAQKGFNKQWRDQNEKYYLKSLDHQGINFKQNDIKALRSKSLFNEIETLYDERHDQHVESGLEAVNGPHLVLSYKDKTILEDAANLLIHHVKRQTGIQKQEKTKIKHILRQFVPDLFFSPRQQLSDDERDDDDIKDIDVDQSDSDTTRKPTTKRSSSSGSGTTMSVDIKDPTLTASTTTTATSHVPSTSLLGSSSTTNATLASALPGAPNADIVIKSEPSELCRTNHPATAVDSDVPMTDVTFSANSASAMELADVKEEMDCDSPTIKPAHAISKHMEEAYTLFFGNNNWYLFLRLHAILCDRLRNMCDRAQMLVAEEAAHRCNRRESTATALRLKPKSEIAVEDYYPTFLDMLKNVLDGNMEAIGYEDALREMFGIHAYVAFTLDRVVTNAVRQLQNCVTERGAVDCVELFHTEQRKNGAGGLCRTATKRMAAEMAYQRRAESSLQDENCFKVYIYKIDCRVTIELLDTETDDPDKASVASQAQWSSYVDQLANPSAGPSGQMPTTATANHRRSSNLSSATEHGSEMKAETTDLDVHMATMQRRPIFLNRNVRRFKKRYANLAAADPTAATPVSRHNPADGQSNTTTSSSSTLSTVSETTNVRISAESSTTSPTTGAQLHATFTQQQHDHSSSVTTTTSSATGGAADAAAATSSAPLSTTTSTTTSLATSSTEATSTVSASPANPNALAEWASRRSPPERMGSTTGVRDGYLVDDCAEIKLNMTSYRMEFVMHKDVIFYKRKSLLRSRQTHPAVTKSMSAKFYKFVNAWCEANVTQPLSHRCFEWFMGREDDLVANTTSQHQSTDVTRTPYRVYNRYRTVRTPSSVPVVVAAIHGSSSSSIVPSAAIAGAPSLAGLATNHLSTMASVVTAAAGRDS